MLVNKQTPKKKNNETKQKTNNPIKVKQSLGTNPT